VAQALVETLMISIVAAAPDADSAERDINLICRTMQEHVRDLYAQYYEGMADAQQTRQ
jgi:hypothetical protein